MEFDLCVKRKELLSDMTEIKLVVPDEGCIGCDFLIYSTHEIRNGCYDDMTYCRLFEYEISNNRKCLFCSLLSKKERTT